MDIIHCYRCFDHLNCNVFFKILLKNMALLCTIFEYCVINVPWVSWDDEAHVTHITKSSWLYMSKPFDGTLHCHMRSWSSVAHNRKDSKQLKLIHHFIVAISYGLGTSRCTLHIVKIVYPSEVHVPVRVVSIRFFGGYSCFDVIRNEDAALVKSNAKPNYNVLRSKIVKTF